MPWWIGAGRRTRQSNPNSETGACEFRGNAPGAWRLRRFTIRRLAPFFRPKPCVRCSRVNAALGARDGSFRTVPERSSGQRPHVLMRENVTGWRTLKRSEAVTMHGSERRRLGGSRRGKSARAIHTSSFGSPVSEYFALRKRRASATLDDVSRGDGGATPA